MENENMYFTHQHQLDYIESLIKTDISPLERKMLKSVLISIYDSKTRVREVGGNVHVTMSHERYRKYIDVVVTPEQLQPK